MRSSSINRAVHGLASGSWPWRSVLAACCVTWLIGCASSPTETVSDPLAGVPPAALARYADGLAALESGHVVRATATFEGLARDYPRSTGPLRQLAWLAADAGDAAAGFDYLVRALEICEACAPVLTDLGVMHRQRGEFDAAEQAYRDALAADRDYAAAHFNLAVLYELYRMQPRVAIEHYERFLALEEDAPDARQIRAWVAELERQAQNVSSTAQIERRP